MPKLPITEEPILDFTSKLQNLIVWKDHPDLSTKQQKLFTQIINNITYTFPYSWARSIKTLDVVTTTHRPYIIFEAENVNYSSVAKWLSVTVKIFLDSPTKATVTFKPTPRNSWHITDYRTEQPLISSMNATKHESWLHLRDSIYPMLKAQYPNHIGGNASGLTNPRLPGCY